jgi:hypothetical protein
MTPDELEALNDEDFAAMIRLMGVEAATWERVNDKAGRR